ncbi:Per1-like [Cohaesibacter sp. ES.047]|uniref:ceramidase domain-containing protein n=1 Tax=Cohaesibacter sp. ES.047 TaxID=1798205 RepID=UPI000BB7D40E|nr:ceramidase domain-containing protein [Cohaesibacter sp. ES.047]SNY92497.1 Per1-like [Cohaesibacter sp. ES.047]
MDLFTSVDIYCERTDASYWSEPINAVTNLSFILAAIWAYWVYRAIRHNSNRRGHDVQILVAIVMAGLIGIGSYLFHTHAQVWSSLADVIPIWTFVAFYLFLAIYRIVGTSLVRALTVYGVSLAVIAALIYLVSNLILASDSASAGSDGFNGSLQYLPGILALFGFALVMAIKRHPARGWIFAAAVTFTLSIVFRSVDMAVCARFPLGTHFLWHLLNGLFIGLLLQALVRHGQPRLAKAYRN